MLEKSCSGVQDGPFLASREHIGANKCTTKKNKKSALKTEPEKVTDTCDLGFMFGSLSWSLGGLFGPLE